MFLLYSTPASLISKTQLLDSSGNFNNEVFLPNNKYFKVKDSLGVPRGLIGLSPDNVFYISYGGGGITDVILCKVDNALYFWKFNAGLTTTAAAINNNGDYSSDGGTTFVDVSASIPNFLKYTQTDNTEYSTDQTDYIALKTFTALTPSSIENFILGAKMVVDVKNGTEGTNSTVKMDFVNGVVQGISEFTENSGTYVTHTKYERFYQGPNGLGLQDSYTITVYGKTANGNGACSCFIRNTTVVIYYLAKCAED